MPKPTDIRPVAVELYFLPIKARMPLKFGPEVTTEVTCARVKMTVEDRRGPQAEGWGETPLSVQWVWPSPLGYEERHEALRTLCIRIAEAWIAVADPPAIPWRSATLPRTCPARGDEPFNDRRGGRRAGPLARRPGLQLAVRPRPARRLRRAPRRPDFETYNDST